MPTSLRTTILEMATADYNPGESWVKRINAINEEHETGYMYEGPFLNDGDTIEPGFVLYLACKLCGRERHHTKLYYLIYMDPDGQLHRAGAMTTGDVKGWAMRLKDAVSYWLDHLERLRQREEKQRSKPPDEIDSAMQHLYARLAQFALHQEISSQPFLWKETDQAAIQLLLDELDRKQ